MEKGGLFSNNDISNTKLNNTNKYKGTKITFCSLLDDTDISYISNIEESIKAIQYYNNLYTEVFNIELKYTVEEWINILETILSNNTGNDDDLELTIKAIDKHFNTEYKHKEMYLLHNFKDDVKDHRIYECI